LTTRVKPSDSYWVVRSRTDPKACLMTGQPDGLMGLMAILGILEQVLANCVL
jgi:hypothetical protein